MRIPMRLALSLTLAALTFWAAPAASQSQNQANSSRSRASTQQQQTTKDTQLPFITLEESKRSPVGTYVYIRARVISKKNPQEGSQQPYSLYLADNTATLRVVVFPDVWNAIKQKELIDRGVFVDVYGQTSEFKGTRELTVVRPNYIRITPGSPIGAAAAREVETSNMYMSVSPGAINYQTIGQPVKVTGKVTNIEEPEKESQPWKITISDISGDIEVIYWKDLAEKIPSQHRPKQDRQMEVMGTVSEYRGVLQIQVDQPEHVKTVANQAARRSR